MRCPLHHLHSSYILPFSTRATPYPIFQAHINMINIREFIADPSRLDKMTLLQLQQIVHDYPFFQAARLLYVANLHKLHDSMFNGELRRASLFVPDRSALFNLTESKKYELENIGSNAALQAAEEDNRTISIINSFLSGTSGIETEELHDRKGNRPSVADLTNDYASYLMQQDAASSTQQDAAPPRLKGEELIDSFILETQGKQRLQMPDRESDEFTSPELSEEEEEIYTESMVNIYIKQGRYQQALEILHKICLNNPKKNSNFASQIKLLEIITSSKNDVPKQS